MKAKKLLVQLILYTMDIRACSLRYSREGVRGIEKYPSVIEQTNGNRCIQKPPMSLPLFNTVSVLPVDLQPSSDVFLCRIVLPCPLNAALAAITEIVGSSAVSPYNVRWGYGS